MKLSEKIRALDYELSSKGAKMLAGEAKRLESTNATLLEALAEALYTDHVMEVNPTVLWNKQSDAIKQLWRDKAIREAKEKRDEQNRL